ncbi:hypothetical protein AcV5_004698 [Taiwanofungus camphoratus]|nr:hypothetical protein AcV5_004698 [Antrodia cinnamomea]
MDGGMGKLTECSQVLLCLDLTAECSQDLMTGPGLTKRLKAVIKGLEKLPFLDKMAYNSVTGSSQSCMFWWQLMLRLNCRLTLFLVESQSHLHSRCARSASGNVQVRKVNVFNSSE